NRDGNRKCFSSKSAIARKIVATSTAPNSSTTTYRSCHSKSAAAASAMAINARRIKTRSFPGCSLSVTAQSALAPAKRSCGLLPGAASRFDLGPVEFRRLSVGQHVGNGDLELVFQAVDHRGLAFLHRFPAGFRDVGGIGLFRLPDLRVVKLGAVEERRLGRSGLEAGDGHSA